MGAQVTQVVVEVAREGKPNAVLTQAVVEIIGDDGTEGGGGGNGGNGDGEVQPVVFVAS